MGGLRAAGAGAARACAATRTERVLVVEDNAVNQQVARAMLNELGFEAEVAANGREALDAARRAVVRRWC